MRQIGGLFQKPPPLRGGHAATLVEDEAMGQQAVHELRRVRGQDQGPPAAGPVGEEFDHAGLPGGVQAGKGFVQDQQLRRMDHAPGEHDLPCLAVGQGGHGALQPVAHAPGPGQIQSLLGLSRSQAPVDAEPVAHARQQHVPACGAGLDALADPGRENADAPSDIGHTDEPRAPEPGRGPARPRPAIPRDQLQQGGLAAAVGAEHAPALTAANRPGQVVHGGPAVHDHGTGAQIHDGSGPRLVRLPIGQIQRPGPHARGPVHEPAVFDVDAPPHRIGHGQQSVPADQQPGPACVRDTVHGIQQPQLALPVQALGQLVHGQKRRSGDDGPGQESALGLTRGHGAHGPVQHGAKPHVAAELPGRLAILIRGGMVEKGGVAQARTDDLPDGHAQVVALVPVGHGRRDQAHVRPDDDGRRRGLAPVDVGPRSAAALGRPQLAHQQAQQRGLAGPVVAHHGEMGAAGDVQVQVVQNAGRSEIHVHVIEMYFETVHASSRGAGGEKPRPVGQS